MWEVAPKFLNRHTFYERVRADAGLPYLPATEDSMTLLSPLSRRAFLVSSGLGFAAEALAARIADADDLGGGPCAAAQAHAVLAGAAEPGVRLVVRGRLFAPDGESPAAGAIVYAYQTDAKGVYAPEQSAPPRLRAFMKTDAGALPVRNDPSRLLSGHQEPGPCPPSGLGRGLASAVAGGAQFHRRSLRERGES